MVANVPGVSNHTNLTPPRPFVDALAGNYFIGDEERQQRVELLTHLLPYGGVLLLWGEPGIGKTSLLAYLETRVGESCRVCRLDANVCTEPRELVQQMLDCFVWQSDIKRSLGGAQLRALREHLGILRRNGFAPVLMIDDAENLSDTAFGVLEQLFDEDNPNLLTLVLAGDGELKKRMASPVLQPLTSQVAHELELMPFSAAEQAEYVRARLTWVDIEEMGPFHPAALKFINAASRGVPRRINELAQVFWENKAGNTSEDRPTRRWQGQLRYVAPIVLISLAVALFNEPIRTALFPDTDSQSDIMVADTRGNTTMPLPADGDAMGDVDQMSASAPSRNIDNTDPVAAGVISDSDVSVHESTTNAAPVTKQIATETFEALAGEMISTRPEQIDSQTRTVTDAIVERVQAQLDTTSPPQRQAGVTAIPQSQGQWWLSQQADQYAIQLIAMGADEVRLFLREHDLEGDVSTYQVKGPEADLLAVAVGPIASKNEAQARSRDWQKRLPGIQPWVRSVASIQKVIQDNEGFPSSEWLSQVKANEQQLLQAPANGYTVQLLAMDEKAVSGFVTKHGLVDKVNYFRTRVDGKERYAAVMVGYSDREQALAAGHRIAVEVKGIHPWIRSLASVQEVIRSYEHHPR